MPLPLQNTPFVGSAVRGLHLMAATASGVTVTTSVGWAFAKALEHGAPCQAAAEACRPVPNLGPMLAAANVGSALLSTVPAVVAALVPPRRYSAGMAATFSALFAVPMAYPAAGLGALILRKDSDAMAFVAFEGFGVTFGALMGLGAGCFALAGLCEYRAYLSGGCLDTFSTPESGVTDGNSQVVRGGPAARGPHYPAEVAGMLPPRYEPPCESTPLLEHHTKATV